MKMCKEITVTITLHIVSIQKNSIAMPIRVEGCVFPVASNRCRTVTTIILVGQLMPTSDHPQRVDGLYSSGVALDCLSVQEYQIPVTAIRESICSPSHGTRQSHRLAASESETDVVVESL